MEEEILKGCQANMEKRVQGLDLELGKVRTGRASITILDPVRVDYYGAPTPLNQVANLATPDARTIVITPFEKKLLSTIEKSILVANLGVQPANDGNVIRIPIPQLTEERRKELVKQLKKIGEDAKVQIRQIRREANESVKKKEKSKELPEDDSKKIQAEIQKITDSFVGKIDEKLQKKESEIMKV